MGNGKLKNVLLNVGNVVISDKPAIYWTPLGPCISIIFHDPDTKLYAISHSQFPEEKNIDNKLNATCPTRRFRVNAHGDSFLKYVTDSIQYIVKCLEGMENDISNMNIYLFGGTVKKSEYEDNNLDEHRNSIAAINLLNSLNLRIKYKDTGGDKSRTLFFNTTNGDFEINYL